MSDFQLIAIALFVGAVVIVSRDLIVCAMGWWKRDKFTSIFLAVIGATGFGLYTLIIEHLIQYGETIL